MVRKVESFIRITGEGDQEERLMLNAYTDLSNSADVIYTVRLPIPQQRGGKIVMGEADIRIVDANSLDDAFNRIEATVEDHMKKVESLLRNAALTAPVSPSEVNKLITS